MIENGSHPIPLPRYLKESLSAFFTSAGMAPKTYGEYTNIEISGQRPQTEKEKSQRDGLKEQ